jgi:hypothetical protein
VGYSELMKTVVKEYQYIYTGQNVDVLKFDININNLFYAGTNPSPENEGSKTDNQDQKLSEQKNKTTKLVKGKPLRHKQLKWVELDQTEILDY